jgi:hypothetical protein
LLSGSKAIARGSAFHPRAELVLGQELHRLRSGVAVEKILPRETASGAEPDRRRLRGGAFILDACAPGLATRLLAVFRGPGELQSGQRDAARPQVAFRAVAAGRVRVAQAVAAQRATTARAGGGLVELALLLAEHDELDEIEQRALAAAVRAGDEREACHIDELAVAIPVHREDAAQGDALMAHAATSPPSASSLTG